MLKSVRSCCYSTFSYLNPNLSLPSDLDSAGGVALEHNGKASWTWNILGPLQDCEYTLKTPFKVNTDVVVSIGYT